MNKNTFLKILDVFIKFLLMITVLCFIISFFSSCDNKAYYREVDNLDEDCYQKVRVEGHDYILFTNKVGTSLGFTHSGNCICNPHKNDTLR